MQSENRELLLMAFVGFLLFVGMVAVSVVAILIVANALL